MHRFGGLHFHGRYFTENDWGDFSTGEEPAVAQPESSKEGGTAANEVNDDWGDFQ